MPQHGSPNSLKKATSRQALSISGQLSMFDQPTLPDSSNVISLPGSEDGRLLSELPDGPTTAKSGPAPAPASRSVRPASKRVSPTTVTCGPSGVSLSASDALQSSLESKLRARLHGSDLCEVTWKPWTTPWGQCLSKPRARVRTTSETASGLWATIRASDGEKGGPNMKFGAGGQPLPAMAAHSIWQTPVADDCVDRVKGKVNSRGEPKLSAQAIQASWPTPTTRDHKDGAYCANVPINGLLGRMVWPTPRANEGTGAKIPPGRQGGMSLKATVNTIGSQAPTGKRGALNPEFVCWLMGFPPVWVSCGVSAMQSTTGRQRRSSKPRAKQSLNSDITSED